ncbi:hypothetical protein ACSS31_28650 (plasmid) [Priestia megaterium]
MKLFNKAEKEKKSVQDMIPIKAIIDGRIITKDDRIVQIMKAGSLNLELMNEYEQRTVFHKFELMLKSMTFPSQIEVISQPLNLHKYREEQVRILEQITNPYRRELLESTIEYVKEKENTRSIMQRKRYIIFDSKIQTLDEKGYEKAVEKIKDREAIVLKGMKSLDIPCSRLTKTEINQLFQILFDYEGALRIPILMDEVPNITTLGGKEKCEKQSISSKERKTKAIVNF